MPQVITEFWGGLSGGARVVLQLLALAGMVGTFAIATDDFRTLPATVKANTVEIRELREDSDAQSARLDRIICYLEAQATGANALRCNR